MRRAYGAAALVALIVPAAAIGQRADEPAAPPLRAITVPEGWQALPAIADAARTAAGDLGPRGLSAAAWGRPLLGCYAVQLGVGVDGAFTPAKLLGQVRTALAGAATVDEWAEGQALATARFSRAGWRGELRAAIATGNRPGLELVACFANERAPDRCDSACAPLLAALPAPTTRTP